MSGEASGEAPIPALAPSVLAEVYEHARAG